MEGQLTQVSVSYKYSTNDPNNLSKSIGTELNSCICITNAKEALKILQNEPNYQNLISVLEFLSERTSVIHISSPSPRSAEIVHVLVSKVVPLYWENFTGSDEKRKLKSTPELRLLKSCLQNVTSLNSIILHLKQCIQVSQEPTDQASQGPSIREYLKIYLDLLEVILMDENVIMKIWKDTVKNHGNSVMLRSLWKEVLRTFISGKIIGISAEAEELLRNHREQIRHIYWFTNGGQYSLWLARNIVSWVKDMQVTSEADLRYCGELMGKSLSLGYSDVVIKEIVRALVLKDDCSTQFSRLCAELTSSEQRIMIHSLLKTSSSEYLQSNTIFGDDQWWKVDAQSVSAVAGLVSIISENERIKDHLVTWLCSNFGSTLEGIAIKRSVLAAIAKDESCMESVFGKCLEQFGDRLYIRHTPILQQEVICQILLLAAGYVHRRSPLRLRMILQSGANLNAVSNRLTASSNRARFLGMIVGEAVSSLVDKVENKMDFKVDEMKTIEAQWYKGLVQVSDNVGPLNSIRCGEEVKNQKLAAKRDEKGSVKPKSTVSVDSKDLSDQKIDLNDKESDHDSLDLYSKPDSDPEDSDDDPTTINRNKLVAPVYIRDLINYLRNSESFDHQRLGLSVAASLIRRKANFGTEVSDHAEELAKLLVGIQDKYEIENFSSMRLQGMVAILVAVPSKMGRWFSNTFFAGDFSISQRSSILTTLGLSAREIGDLDIENDSTLLSKEKLKTLFPSKILPVNMERHYATELCSQLDTLSNQLEKKMIKPMAASLVDKLTGPAILKIRTFSSRMEVEKNRQKPRANNLSKIPFLLSHFIKTLAIILHAAGPFTPSLTPMTSEFWDLLLGLRIQMRDERIVWEAMCFGFLTLLELNLDKSELVHLNGRQLLETQEWVSLILERLGEGDEEERCKMLAAGCMVRIQEIVERYQKRLLGQS